METKIKLNKRGLNSVEVLVRKEYDENYDTCEWVAIAEFYKRELAEKLAHEIRQIKIEEPTLQELGASLQRHDCKNCVHWCELSDAKYCDLNCINVTGRCSAFLDVDW